MPFLRLLESLSFRSSVPWESLLALRLCSGPSWRVSSLALSPTTPPAGFPLVTTGCSNRRCAWSSFSQLHCSWPLVALAGLGLWARSTHRSSRRPSPGSSSLALLSVSVLWSGELPSCSSQHFLLVHRSLGVVISRTHPRRSIAWSTELTDILLLYRSYANACYPKQGGDTFSVMMLTSRSAIFGMTYIVK